MTQPSAQHPSSSTHWSEDRRYQLGWVRRWLREAVRDNTWIVPAVGAIAGLALANAVGTRGPQDAGWTVSVDRARDTLTSSVALVFTALSIVLALSSVAAQNVVTRYGSRTLRLYLRRSAAQWVIGVFLTAVAFVFTQQFGLRRLDPNAPAPVAGLVISILLMTLTCGAMIMYVSAVVRWFRVDKAIITLRKATVEAAAAVVRSGRATTTVPSIPQRPSTATDLMAPRSGHLAAIDTDALLALCQPLDAIAVVSEPLGAAVVKGQPIGWIAGPRPTSAVPPDHEIGEAIDVTSTRELRLNIEYGLIGLVDMAIIALSPAVNDPNTAVEVIEELTFLYHHIATASLGPYAVPHAQATPRVVVYARTFGELVKLGTTQIVLYGLTDPMVVRALRRLAHSLQLLDLNDDDRSHVDEFAATLAATPAS